MCIDALPKSETFAYHGIALGHSIIQSQFSMLSADALTSVRTLRHALSDTLTDQDRLKNLIKLLDS